MEPVITRASAADADVVGRLLYDFNTEFDSAGPGASEFGARFERLLQDEDAVVVLLAGDRADPVGFAFLTLRPTPYYDGPLAQLEELYVRPAERGRGIGTELLTSALELVRKRGGREMQINVDDVDTGARRFYERHGFTNIEPGADYRMLCYVQEL
jgi:GNAT superfamily N-acetyltransferase